MNNVMFIGMIVFYNLLYMMLIYLRKIHMREMDILYVTFFAGMFFFLIQCVMIGVKYSLPEIKNTILNKIDRKFYISLFIASLIYVTMLTLWLYLLKYTKVSKFIPIKTGMMILFSIILAIVAFKEKIDLKNALGVVLIIIGILLVGEIKT